MQLKLIFPNSNKIYLHDTPAKSLFNEDARTFSHGFIRVGEPRELAIRVLKHDPNWTTEKIDAAMNRSVEITVMLEKRIHYLKAISRLLLTKMATSILEMMFTRGIVAY